MVVNTVYALKYLNNYLCVDLKARSTAKFNFDDEFFVNGYKIVCFKPFQFDSVYIKKNKTNYTAILHTYDKKVYSFDFDGSLKEAKKNMEGKFRIL